MATDQGTPTNDSDVPAWIEASLFEPVFKEVYPEFRQTTDFKVNKALGDGENYATIMLRLEAAIELNDGSAKTLTLMLKTAHDSEIYRELMKSNNIFDVEATMYSEVVPEFEQMFKDVGLEVKFGAKAYQISTQQPHILLEDLRPKGFINVERQEGLDMEHTHCVLKKLAQWHAASAVRVATRGDFKASICSGFFKKETFEAMRGMMEDLHNIQMECIKEFDGHELYFERMCEKKDIRFEEFHDASMVDENEFNVLNHGDCWANNIMFRHDVCGNIEETYLIDYQVPRYGAPAQDLYYILLSSTKYELKINKFDYFIRYYHDHLVEYLNLLKYPKKLPTLKDIHIMLHKYNPWALSTATGIMAAVLLDPYEGANLENFLGSSDADMKFKVQLYSSPRYRKHCEMVLPWLYNRGAI